MINFQGIYPKWVKSGKDREFSKNFGQHADFVVNIFLLMKNLSRQLFNSASNLCREHSFLVLKGCREVWKFLKMSGKSHGIAREFHFAISVVTLVGFCRPFEIRAKIRSLINSFKVA